MGRRVLHVQSISEWAPSCIGPYSQATTHAGLVHFAGQIALDPATMGVVPGGIDAQCARCLASCQAVAVAVRTDLPQSLLWCTVYSSAAAGAAGPQRAQHHLQRFLDGHPPGDGDSGGSSAAAAAAADERPGEAEEEEEPRSPAASWERCGASSHEEGEEDAVLDDYLLPPEMRRHWRPLLAFVAVPELPRG